MGFEDDIRIWSLRAAYMIMLLLACLAHTFEAARNDLQARPRRQLQDTLPQLSSELNGCNLIALPCNGPSNQVISIKETVVLASLLGCNVIMHGVLNHISEANITRPDVQCGLGVKRQRFKSKGKKRRKRLKRAGRVQGNDGRNADIGGLNHGGDNVIAGARRSLSHVSPRWQDDDTSSDTMHTDVGFYQGLLEGDLAPAAGSDPHGQLRSLQQAAGADGSGSDVHDVLMPYDLLFDRSGLASSGVGGVRRVMSIEEAVAGGWDKTIDSVWHFKRDCYFSFYFERLARLTGLRLADETLASTNSSSMHVDSGNTGSSSMGTTHPRAWYLNNSRNRFTCGGDSLAQLRAHLHSTGGRFILVYIYHQLVNAFASRHQMPSIVVSASQCSHAYWKVSGVLSKSAAIRQAATSFISRHWPQLDQSQQNFVAVHMRPFADDCLEVWKQTVFDTDANIQFCDVPGLYWGIGREVRRRMDQQGMTGSKVFVMSHPAIRHTVSDVFSRHNFTPVFMNLQDIPTPLMEAVPGLAQHAAVSLLGLIEQEVCKQSHVFIGSYQSSMSRNVILARVAPGGCDRKARRTLYVQEGFDGLSGQGVVGGGGEKEEFLPGEW